MKFLENFFNCFYLVGVEIVLKRGESKSLFIYLLFFMYLT